MIELRTLTEEELEELNGIGFYRLKDVLKVFPVGKSHWYAGIQDGKYPRPIKLGPRMSIWRKEDIKALIGHINAENN